MPADISNERDTGLTVFNWFHALFYNRCFLGVYYGILKRYYMCAHRELLKHEVGILDEYSHRARRNILVWN